MQEPEFCKKNIWVLPNIWVLGEPEFCSKRSKKPLLYSILNTTWTILLPSAVIWWVFPNRPNAIRSIFLFVVLLYEGQSHLHRKAIRRPRAVLVAAVWRLLRASRTQYGVVCAFIDHTHTTTTSTLRHRRVRLIRMKKKGPQKAAQ